MTQTCTLPGRPEAARAAREFTAACLPGCPAADDAALCVDELVANAIQHSRSGLPSGTVTVRVAVAPGKWLRVEVEDAGPLRAAMPSQRAALDERGRGLALVVSLAEVFGADGGLRWFWMPWAPGVREAWDQRTFAEVIRAAEAAGWEPGSEASRPALQPPIQIPAQLRKPVVTCEVRKPLGRLNPAGGAS
jgi:anti-sigma regulatory factor (Ser/Thr protein kinase)